MPVRKVVRPTRFYYMLLQRLKDHRTMDDGAVWSAQADFIARLSEWDKDSDPLWPLLRAERAALLALNVPHFVAPSDGDEIADAYGASARTQAVSGLARARERLQKFDDREIAWQIDVIRENTNSILPADARSQAAASEKLAFEPIDAAPAKASFIAEADRIAAELARYAIRRGPAAAWIGLDWLGDSEVFQLVCLGPDLYNGSTGIAVFLAAHAAATRHQPSRELALAALAQLRKNLTSRNVPRLARALGIGAATGLGSIVYALAVMAKCLDDGDLLADAEMAATLVTDELIAADKQLDVMGGSAGAILGLLRLHRDTGSSDGAQPRDQVRLSIFWRNPASERRTAGAGSDKSFAHKRMRQVVLAPIRRDTRIERHVAWRRRLCLRPFVLGGGDRPRGFCQGRVGMHRV